MLERQIAPYGTENPAELMDSFYQIGTEMLLELRNLVTSPEERKQARTWGAVDATKMVGVSAPTFRKLQKEYNIPGIIIEEAEKNRKIKKYTLSAINSLREKAQTRYFRPEGSAPLIIAVTNLKGGVGKTETAVDLGKKIAMEGMRSLLVDLDAQGTATLVSSGRIPDLEIPYDKTITNSLMNSPKNIEEIVLKTHFDGFDIIPANLAIQDCDLMLPNDKVNNHEHLGSPFERLKAALEIIKNQYDVIIIDCGPNIGFLTLNSIIACNGMIIPIPPSMYDYSSFVMYTATLSNMFKNLPKKPLDYLRIIISKHPGSNEALQMENMMREQFGRYILSNHMCETVEVPKAANEIGTIYDVTRPRGSREAYRRALQHLNDVNMEIINNFKDIWRIQAERNSQTERSSKVEV